MAVKSLAFLLAIVFSDMSPQARDTKEKTTTNGTTSN